jgi:hypothetical protein
MTHGHRDFTVCSCSSLPVLLPTMAGAQVLLAALKCSTTAVVSGEPVMRSARTNARRRIAASKHCGSGCNQAPRPGSFLAESTVTADSPFPPSTATTRSSSTASSRFRQPTHVRTGPFGGPIADMASAAEVSRWITAESTVPAPSKETALPGTSRNHAADAAIHPTDLLHADHCRAGLVVLNGSLGRLGLRRGITSDIDPPARQSGREPGVLTFLADRE